MPAVPQRLKPKRSALLRHPVQDQSLWNGMAWSGGYLLRRVRVIRRTLLAILWTLIAIPVQAVMLVVPGRAKVHFARIYWEVMCWVLGVRVRVIGRPVQHGQAGRPVIYVPNHSSWLDIPVLGGKLGGCFVAKEEIARWPIVSQIARLGRTVYTRRTRTSTPRERDEMRRRMAQGDNLILFPEGTTSDGSRVLPFRTAFLSAAELPVTADGKPPLVQPISVAYDRLSFLPTGRTSRSLFAWYGDMELGPHFWRLGQHRGLRVTLLFHTPLDPAAFASRKELSRATWTIIADGASTLRQNRPARPITLGEAAATGQPANPAFV